MATSESRFLIIDGVQISRVRAERMGLLEGKSEDAPVGSSSTARTPQSARSGNPAARQLTPAQLKAKEKAEAKEALAATGAPAAATGDDSTPPPATGDASDGSSTDDGSDAGNGTGGDE